MRVVYFLLAVIATIPGIAATNIEQTSISTGQDRAIDALLNNAKFTRFLRSNQLTEDGGDVGQNQRNEEERLSRQALNTLLDGDTAYKFAKWKRKGFSANTIYEKLSVSTHSDRLWIYNKYVKYLNE
ncbi:hypothetical protein PHMEG_00020509 [Phytophthora megakarya]|uniref:RxLR effector protein n=1 Tax=Phytophthora megakarya TaxID=4795 RepID=A0A225VQ25_9STRA|nr:hypothetical protein PHMEG_00020509 [Phytophthora megakarya]